MAQRLTSLSTFTGLGGLDLGLEAAGFDALACVEWDDAARQADGCPSSCEWCSKPLP